MALERRSRTRWQQPSGERATVSPPLPEGDGLGVMTTPAANIARLVMDARYHLERRDLYRAKAHGPHAVSAVRMRGLEQAYDRAAERLHSAEAK